MFSSHGYFMQQSNYDLLKGFFYGLNYNFSTVFYSDFNSTNMNFMFIRVKAISIINLHWLLSKTMHFIHWTKKKTTTLMHFLSFSSHTHTHNERDNIFHLMSFEKKCNFINISWEKTLIMWMAWCII